MKHEDTCKLRRIFSQIAGGAISIFARLVTAPRIVFHEPPKKDRQRVYFANHTSNADTVLIWTAIGRSERKRTRPVAAADYWLTSPMRSFIGEDVFRILPIDRHAQDRKVDPIARMSDALSDGTSLIIFPEGRRNDSDAPLLDLKPGIYHLAKQHPEVDFIPVWIDNLGGVMPRGEIVPVPLICTVTFGAALRIEDSEDRHSFMERARHALIGLAPADIFKPEPAHD